MNVIQHLTNSQDLISHTEKCRISKTYLKPLTAQETEEKSYQPL